MKLHSNSWSSREVLQSSAAVDAAAGAAPGTSQFLKLLNSPYCAINIDVKFIWCPTGRRARSSSLLTGNVIPKIIELGVDFHDDSLYSRDRNRVWYLWKDSYEDSISRFAEQLENWPEAWSSPQFEHKNCDRVVIYNLILEYHNKGQDKRSYSALASKLYGLG